MDEAASVIQGTAKLARLSPLPILVITGVLGCGMVMQNQRDLVGMASEIVSAYVSNNPVPSQELPALIRTIHSALTEIANLNGAAAATPPQEPAVPIKKSVTPEFIVCLEDGKKFKSLKRHLRTRYGMTPEEYRAKWNLPHDYPMVAPNYAKERSNLAKRMGLGQARKGN